MIYKVYRSELSGTRHVTDEKDYRTFLCGRATTGQIESEALTNPAYILNATFGLCAGCARSLRHHADEGRR